MSETRPDLRPERQPDDGASSVEYALIAVAIAAVIASIVVILGQTVLSSYEVTCQEVSNGSGVC